jgi:DNA repair exonuclease SbcCD ATPase subunit
MQLKARHRREVVEEILDIQIFSLMNMILKTRLTGIKTDQKEVEFQSELSSEKIELHEKLIKEMKKNNTQIIEEKTNKIKKNIEDINDKKISIEDLNKIDQELLSQITDSDKVNKDLVKLKDIKSTLREKHKSHSDTVNFFKSNEDCPTCEQHIGDLFKKDMILSKDKEVKKFSKALEELDAVLSDNTKRHKEIKSIMDTIRENEVQIAKDNSSIMQLEKFQSTLESEIKSLESQDVNKSDTDKLDELKKISVNLEKERSKLREDQTYGEAVRNMLQDTGIKTKIIKQYLPIMNKLINTYLTAMEFYVNFTLDENFEETIKSRYRDEFSYPSFSEGEKMRIDLALLFTWRAIAKMKNSANTNLLILDEIFDSSLDSGGTDEFLKILNTLGGENVFVISHKQDALVDKFKSTIKFEKIKNFSHVAVN